MSRAPKDSASLPPRGARRPGLLTRTSAGHKGPEDDSSSGDDSVPVRTTPLKTVDAPQRISKLLARAGVGSRRDIERMIAEGRIAINGVVVDTPVTNKTSLAGVTVDGKPAPDIEATQVWRFHKPAGCLTTRRDPRERTTIYDHLPEELHSLNPIGRLDYNTEGLLLLTNDGGLKRELELPSSGVMRRYRARVRGDLNRKRLENLIHGVTIDGIRYGSIDVDVEGKTAAGTHWLGISLSEGKNREVRNVLAYLGLQVTRLLRISYGPYGLDDLPPKAVALWPNGKPRLLEEEEVTAASQMNNPSIERRSLPPRTRRDGSTPEAPSQPQRRFDKPAPFKSSPGNRPPRGEWGPPSRSTGERPVRERRPEGERTEGERARPAYRSDRAPAPYKEGRPAYRGDSSRPEGGERKPTSRFGPRFGDKAEGNRERPTGDRTEGRAGARTSYGDRTGAERGERPARSATPGRAPHGAANRDGKPFARSGEKAPYRAESDRNSSGGTRPPRREEEGNRTPRGEGRFAPAASGKGAYKGNARPQGSPTRDGHAAGYQGSKPPRSGTGQTNSRSGTGQAGTEQANRFSKPGRPTSSGPRTGPGTGPRSSGPKSGPRSGGKPSGWRP